MFELLTRTLLPLALVILSVAAYPKDALRDPTRPPDAVEAPVTERAPRFVVSAIFIAENRRVAVLNGRAVSVGDRVHGAEVRAVTAHDVELGYRGRTLRVRLDLARIRE